MAKRVPTPVRDLDVMALPLNTLEGFVLSRVDGSSTVEDIAMMVSVDSAELLEILEHLAHLGAVELAWLGRRARPRPRPPPKEEPPEVPSDIAVSYDPAELEEDVEVPMAVRKQILQAFYSQDQKDRRPD